MILKAHLELLATSVQHVCFFLQLDVDIGSSSIAKGVVNLVLGYLSTLVIELAFLIQVKFHCILCFDHRHNILE